MIIVTGGAGFIGSNVIAALNERGRQDIILCDSLGSDDKWRNLNGKSIIDILSPPELASLMQRGSLGRYEGKIEAVFHLGANSSTVETNVDSLITDNFRYSCDLWRTCASKGIRLIYASSAATYGDGNAGFTDGLDDKLLTTLRPLNAYGWTKHLFDQNVARWVQDPSTRPPQYAGLKFFNVYGPNEYHKGFMKSVVCEKYEMAHQGQPITLFKSYDAKYSDGGQLRDFVYVKDVVAINLYMLEHIQISGIVNVGTGKSRSFNDVALAVINTCRAFESQPQLSIEEARELGIITYCPIPEGLIDKYQSFTEANIDGLQAVGFETKMTALEDGVTDYVNYLHTNT